MSNIIPQLDPSTPQQRGQFMMESQTTQRKEEELEKRNTIKNQSYKLGFRMKVDLSILMLSLGILESSRQLSRVAILHLLLSKRFPIILQKRFLQPTNPQLHVQGGYKTFLFYRIVTFQHSAHIAVHRSRAMPWAKIQAF